MAEDKPQQKAQPKGLSRKSSLSASLNEIPDSLEMSWRLSSTTVDDGIIGSIPDYLGGFEPILSGLSSITDVLNEIQSVLKTLIKDESDPSSALLKALSGVINQFRDLYSSISVSAITHFPGKANEKSTLSPNEVLYDIGMSYLDRDDANRPVASKPVYGVAIVGIWSYPSSEDLYERFIEVMTSLNGKAPKDPVNVSSINLPDEQFLLQASGVAPDWMFKKTLLDIQAFKLLDGYLSNILGLTKKNESGKFNRIQNVLKIVEGKIEKYSNIVKLITDSIDLLDSYFRVTEGSSLLIIKGVGTGQDFANAIVNATNMPTYPFESLGEDGNQASELDDMSIRLYSGAVALHLQTSVPDSSTENIEKILNFFIDGSRDVQVIKGLSSDIF